MERTFEEVLFANYDYVDWFIERTFNMEFLSDQMFGFDDTVHEKFARSCDRDVMRIGYLGYHI